MSDLYHNGSFTVTEAPIEGSEFNDKEIVDKPYNFQTLKFRLLDDDKEVYFVGYMEETKSEALFYPLDTLGASYGCTEIQIFKNGLWSTV